MDAPAESQLNDSVERIIVDNVIVLTENDVPGSSLSGKQPHELNVLQLKRWLACRGAPVTGKKPELIER